MRKKTGESEGGAARRAAPSNVSRDGRIASRFEALRSGKRRQKALITYAMTGFPSEKSALSAITGMIRGGSDIIEMGFPFSDPLADGPAIQEASTVSLGGGAKFDRFLKTAKRVRRDNADTPLVLMTYANVLYNIGYERAASAISESGIDGIILPDMPADEASEYVAEARRRNLDTIFLASPNTSDERLGRIASASTGFLYMVAVYGTTGVKPGGAPSRAADGRKNESRGGRLWRAAADPMPDYTKKAIRRVRRITRGTGLPVGVGFGVSSPADVASYVDAGADAVIVGSAYMDVIKDAHASPRMSVEAGVAAFTRRLKAGTYRRV